MAVGHELKEEDKECRWFMQEKVFENKVWTGAYTGRTYCTYTCSVTKSRPKVKFVDTNACPRLDEIDNTCPLIEPARILESYYLTHKYKAEPIPKAKPHGFIQHNQDKLDEVNRLLDGK
jgi:hypothetical protein